MIALSEERLRRLLAWLAIVLLVVPIGGALWLGVAEGESPCILCWSQRTSMLLIALVALFVVRYGPRPRYLGMLVLLGTWGTFMALRHSSLHVARDVGQGFAGTILGIHTYTWSWVIHWLVLMVGGAVLLGVRGPLAARTEREPSGVARIAMALLVVMAGGNAVQAFVSTGPPPFVGQGDPIRLSLNPRYWVWSMGELEGAVSLRGSWSIPEPDPGAADPDPAAGPLADLPELRVIRWERIEAPIEGRLTDLAYSHPGPGGGDDVAGSVEEGRALAVTDEFGVHVLDATLSRVLHGVVLDPAFSVDLTELAGAAIVGDTLVAMSSNKSFVLLRPDPEADPVREWRHFLDTDGTVSEMARSRFATVRARQMYVSSLAWDPVADELITVSVPSPRHRRMVVSRFAREDLVLSSEFEPRLGPGLATSGPERGLGDLLVTGAAVSDGVLWAISAAGSTLLAIDLRAQTVSGAWAVPGLSEPVGLAVRGGELLVAQADGRIAVVEVPAGPAG